MLVTLIQTTKTASNYADAFDLLLDAYKDIGNSLPQFGKYARLFSNNPGIRKVLVEIFEGILRFHKRAMGFFRRPGLSLPFLIRLEGPPGITQGN